MPVPETDLKDLVVELKTGFEDHKKNIKEQFDELKSKGSSDQLLAEKVDKQNEALTELQTNLNELIKKNARERAADSSAEGIDKKQHKEAFNSFVKMTPDEFRKKDLSVGSDPDGGWLVPVETESRIDQVMRDYSAMRSLATVMKMTALEYEKLTNVGGATSGWVGEETARPKTDTPQLKKQTWRAKELYANPRTTQRVLDNVASASQWLEGEILEAFTEQEGGAFIEGDGVLRPRGILTYELVANANYNNVTDFGKIGYIPSGAAGAFTATDGWQALISLQHAIKRGYRANASWLMNDKTFEAIRKLTYDDGTPVWRMSSSTSLIEGATETLLGKRLEVDDYMPDVAADSLSIAYGDFKKGYLILDQQGMRVTRNPYKEEPYIYFYTTKLLDGAVDRFDAIKIMKFAAS